jgi:hypothetical protein
MLTRDADRGEKNGNGQDIVERLRKIIPNPEKISDEGGVDRAGAMVISLMCTMEDCLDGVPISKIASRVLPEMWNFQAEEQERLLSLLNRDEFIELIRSGIRLALASQGVSLGFEGTDIFDISIDWENMEIRFNGLADAKRRSVAWTSGTCQNSWAIWASESGVEMHELEVALGLANKGGTSYREPRHGDRVRLQVSSSSGPMYGWGNVKNGEVGFVSGIGLGPGQDDLTVDFPSQKGWTGPREDFVLAASPIVGKKGLEETEGEEE